MTAELNAQTEDLTKLDEKDENEELAEGHNYFDYEKPVVKLAPEACVSAKADPLNMAEVPEAGTSSPSKTKNVDNLGMGGDSFKTVSPQPPKLPEGRQFQKTRSFSAVEEAPEKVPFSAKSKDLKFPFKDVAHSRSEQLADQQQPSADDSSQVASPTYDDKEETVDVNKRVSVVSGDIMMRQYGYHDQPVSLQYDTTSVKIPDDTHARKDIRKSGRDLTELGMENMRDRGSGRQNRSNARPRSDSITKTLL